MKGDLMKKIIIIVISIIIGILVYKKSEDIIIPSDAIRVRIIANSNNIKDLYQKKKIKESIKKDLYDLVKNAKSRSEASIVIRNNLDNIKQKLKDNSIEATIDYGLNYFPKKIYNGVVYPDGEYESLVITIGSGLGDNWWCVLYPPLCLVEDNNTVSNVEYKLLIEKLLHVDNK